MLKIYSILLLAVIAPAVIIIIQTGDSVVLLEWFGLDNSSRIAADNTSKVDILSLKYRIFSNIFLQYGLDLFNTFSSLRGSVSSTSRGCIVMSR